MAMKLDGLNNWTLSSVRNFMAMNRTVIIIAILIISVPLILFAFLQHETEDSIYNSIFEQQKQNQKQVTQGISQQIQSDFELILARLEGISNSINTNLEDPLPNMTKSALTDAYNKINDTTPVDRMFLQNKDEIAIFDIGPSGDPIYTGKNFSFRSWVKETKNTMKPVISEMFEGIEGKDRFAITYPIISTNNSGDYYNGLIGVVIPVDEFFRYYGNIYDIQSQYLSAFDHDATILVHPIPSLVGKQFFGEFTQNLIGNDKVLDDMVRRVVSGQPGFAVYDLVGQERLNTGYPIYIEDKPRFSVFVVTPTSLIYSKINEIIDKERLQMLSLITGTIAAVLLLIIYLNKINKTLNKEVNKRTKELQDSNIKLESANKHIQIHDDMQKEFINLTAHELRNPVQSLMGFSEILKKINTLAPKGKENDRYKDPIEAIIRSTRRLKRLVDIIFDVSQLDNNLLMLNKENINMKDFIQEISTNYKYESQTTKKIHKASQKIDDTDSLDRGKKPKYSVEIDFIYADDSKDPIIVSGDRYYLAQVITNLLDNAFEFTHDEGVVKVKLEKSKDNKAAVVTISDNGYGIHPDVLPFLFIKYVKKSKGGAGLSLYISKKIIESHGGNMWARNNQDKNGATFGFSLPFSSGDVFIEK
ncbi:MAG TPA: sensor histidine kinase [Candidatus Nitrosocosmicus sp.]|nr:sensor histidine kinase [Candidatus Nitrosocosmicus sp.]